MRTCFLQSASEHDRFVSPRESLVLFGNFSLRDFSTSERTVSTNFGSTGRLHYFSAVHKVRAHVSLMCVIWNMACKKYQFLVTLMKV